MNHYGLIGRDISYSFSPTYFKEKFSALNTRDSYQLFDIENLEFLPDLINQHKLSGFNVTIPYKETILPYLHKLSREADEIGAVNTVVVKNKRLIGYNTDYIGFRDSLLPFLQKSHQNALILGTGGAAKAVKYALDHLGIASTHVSRHQGLTYSHLEEIAILDYQIIINCTPLGSVNYPTEYIALPYSGVTQNHIFFDLIYNPQETLFLKKAAQNGAITLNGLDMLKKQADAAYNIWQSNL